MKCGIGAGDKLQLEPENRLMKTFHAMIVVLFAMSMSMSMARVSNAAQAAQEVPRTALHKCTTSCWFIVRSSMVQAGIR
jgi:hypothetical protein